MLSTQYGKKRAGGCVKGGIKNPPGADSGILDYCNERAWYARKYRYRERTESSKALGGRMKKMRYLCFSKNQKLREPCGNNQNDMKFSKK